MLLTAELLWEDKSLRSTESVSKLHLFFTHQGVWKPHRHKKLISYQYRNCFHLEMRPLLSAVMKLRRLEWFTVYRWALSGRLQQKRLLHHCLHQSKSPAEDLIKAQSQHLFSCSSSTEHADVLSCPTLSAQSHHQCQKLWCLYFRSVRHNKSA